MDLHLSISNGFVSFKVCDKRDDFDFHIVNFPFLDGDVPRRPSYGVYIFQLIRFASVCSHVEDFDARNKCLTAKLLKQGYRYLKLRKAFSKLYRRHYGLISKFNVRLKSLLHQGLSEPEFHGDLEYKVKEIMGKTNFSDQFRKIKIRHIRIGYDLNVLLQSACLVFNQITVDNFAALFNCTPVYRASDSLMVRPKAIHFSWLGPGRAFVCCLIHRGSTDDLLLLQLFGRPEISICHTTRCICLCFFIVLKPDSFVYLDDSLTS